ncbi:uncharacterized protein B0I36DRAFT_383144 [Microdochium trichocladiopsis]|uniref:Mid2 domain-containing protein n=1 Tax=Microdochium trichocladiopsis TaxID=1682393 RepID=A0A9P9BRW8_9PEZI|nr:uncharacterized protein B0I36DRAFT_383144 [Microdochium trichocladiopsis]KAH7033250.1 hypothetical protein B0I36DRAFT_383144 [Microdochium trichocladiopsis]
MAPVMRRLALLVSFATTYVHAESFWSSSANIDDTLGADVLGSESLESLMGQDLRARAAANFCGTIGGVDQKCPSGQVCSVDHDTQSIGCCPRSNPQCDIPTSCKGFGGDSFFGRFKRADGDNAKPITCSGLILNSCVTYTYSGGPYNGYHMYSCDWVSSSQTINMPEALDSDPDPPSSKTTTSSTTTRPRPTTSVTRTSTRPATTTPTTASDDDDDNSSSTTTDDPSTAANVPPTTTNGVGGVTQATNTGAAATSSRSPTPTAAAADGSTVPQGNNVGAIVGGVLGGLAVVAIGIGAFLYFLWYRKKREQENSYLPAMGYTNDSAFYSQPPLGSAQQQGAATYGARGSQGDYGSVRGMGGSPQNTAGSGAGYGPAAAAGTGAFGTGVAAAAASSPYDRSYSSRHDAGSAFYGKTMDDTAVSPVDTSPVSPLNSPIPSRLSAVRPVSPPQAYNRFNPPPPEHFRAYKPYEGT